MLWVARGGWWWWLWLDFELTGHPTRAFRAVVWFVLWRFRPSETFFVTISGLALGTA